MVAALSGASTGAGGSDGDTGGGTGGGAVGGTVGALGTAEAVDRARRRRAALAGGGGAVAAGLIVGLLVVLPGRGPEITDAAAPAPSLESSVSVQASEPPVPTEAASPTGTPSPSATGPSSSPTAPTPPPTSAAALPARLELSTGSLAIPSFASFGSVSVRNTGGAPLTFTTSVPADAPWLTAAPTTGTIPAGGGVPLDLFVDRARIPSASAEGARTTVLVSWDGGAPRTLAVVVAPEQLIEQDPGSEPATPAPGQPTTPPADQTTTPPADQTQRSTPPDPPTTDPTSGAENP